MARKKQKPLDQAVPFPRSWCIIPARYSDVAPGKKSVKLDLSQIPADEPLSTFDSLKNANPAKKKPRTSRRKSSP